MVNWVVNQDPATTETPQTTAKFRCDQTERKESQEQDGPRGMLAIGLLQHAGLVGYDRGSWVHSLTLDQPGPKRRAERIKSELRGVQ